MADHTRPVHLVYATVRIVDDPLAREQLRRNLPGIFDRDEVGEEVLVLVRLGLLGEVLRAHRHGDAVFVAHGRLDKEKRMRGIYDGTEASQVDTLIDEIKVLMLEK